MPIFTDHIHAYRGAMTDLQRKRHVGAEVTESEEYDRLLAAHYRKGKVRYTSALSLCYDRHGGPLPCH